MHRHFDDELGELKETLLKMAGLADEAITRAVSALVDRDADKAEGVQRDDRAIDLLEIEVDELCLRLLALRQPNSADLRFVTSALRINADLERIGDLAVNISERALDLMAEPQLKPLIDIPRMASTAQGMLDDAIRAFVGNDVALARAVCIRDDEVDSLNDQIFRELLTYMMQDHTSISRAVDLILVGRHLERIADHATNICEDVIYMVEGTNIKHHKEDDGR